MRSGFAVYFFVSMLAGAAQNGPPQQRNPRWHPIDQLCGQIQLERPTTKEMIVNGKRETRQYETYLQGATLDLFPAVDAKGCCGRRASATVQSRRFGSFEFTNVAKGRYWLRVRKGTLQRLVPLHVTEDFDATACHDPSAGRSVIVDSDPPRVELRIR